MAAAEKIPDLPPAVSAAAYPIDPFAFFPDAPADREPTAAHVKKRSRLMSSHSPCIRSSGPGNPPPAPNQKQWFDSVVRMMGLLLKMSVWITNDQATIAINQTNTLDKLGKTAEATGQIICDELSLETAAIQAQENANFWIKICNYAVMAVVVIASFAIMGPAAAILTAGLMALDSLGVIDKMFSGIQDPTARFFAKLGFMVAVTVVCSGGAGLIDGAIASAKTTTAAAEETAATATEDTAAETTQNAVEAAAEEPGPSCWEIQKGAMVANLKNFSLQSLMACNPINDLIEMYVKPGNDPKKKAEVQKWSLICNALLMLCCLGAMHATSSLSTGVKSIPELLTENPGVIMKAIRSPSFYALPTSAFTGLEIRFGVEKSGAQNTEAQAQEDQGPAQGSYTQILQMIKTYSQQTQQSMRQLSDLLKNVGNADFTCFADQSRYAAEALV